MRNRYNPPMRRRLSTLLLLSGTFILLASIIAYQLTNALMPDIPGSDPEKDTHLLGFILTALIGTLLLLTGLPLRIRLPKNPSPPKIPIATPPI
jgi:hypothetical protein